MHPILARQLKRSAFAADASPADSGEWAKFLEAVSGAYEQADQDRYLLERSLALSSEEMGDLHRQLATERDTISAVICALEEGVCAVNDAGEVLFINPEARRLLGIVDGERVEKRVLAEIVGARTAHGTPLAYLLSEGADPENESGEAEPRLIVGEDDGGFIAYSLTRLSEREGLVLTLRDVTARKAMERERQELNKRLVDVSRQAGMAEVASDVLHNVGNVLNSVNVSCSVALDMVKGSRCVDIERVAELMTGRGDRLGAYLCEDPAGSMIPGYLAQLGEHLSGERDDLLNELEALRKSTDHIREIVATQQSLAKVAGARDMECMEALVEEALRITGPGLTRHGVRVVRDFHPADPVCIERHQVLQILVNLINNAKQAYADMPEGPREITLRISGASGRVLTEVNDEGCGIPAENFTRIFMHGFTTRSDGHGFGLHSAALTANAMGGEIRVESDGPGKGSRFILDLPAGKTQGSKAA